MAAPYVERTVTAAAQFAAPGTPPYVQVLLKEVRLVVEQSAPPVGHVGEFWCRRLTDYGRDVMRALARASSPGFAYPETFAGPEDADVPALALLAAADAQVNGLWRAGAPPDAAALAAAPYLCAQRVTVDAGRLAALLGPLLAALDGGCYDAAGRKDPAALRRAMIARRS